MLMTFVSYFPICSKGCNDLIYTRYKVLILNRASTDTNGGEKIIVEMGFCNEKADYV